MLPSPYVDVLPKLPLAAHSLLHAGCGDGQLARLYRSKNPAARLLGTEIDRAQAEQAAAAFDFVAVTDIETSPLPFDLPHGIDCLLYDGILERLHNPWRVVAAQAEALTPDGVVVMSLPNPGAWQVLERMLHGRPAPELLSPAAGFTAEAVMRNLARVGLVACDIMECQVSRPLAAPFLEAMSPVLNSLGVDGEAFAKRASAARLLWRARKEPRQRIFLSGNMLAPVGGVSHVRVVHPLQAMASDPSIITEVTDVVNTRPAQDASPRIFVLHRPALTGEQGFQLIQALTKAGHLLITEFDDHPDFFPMMQNGGALSFEGVHAVQTSTPALAEVLRRYNPEVAVFPNAVARLPEIRNFTQPDVVTVFFGALNREDDWVPLMPVLNEVAALAGERLRFEVIHDKNFFDALNVTHKAFTPTCDYDTYLQILGRCEVSFMPLSDTLFNRTKSDLKFIEAGACRVASLASPVVYAGSIEHGRTGLLFANAEELRMNLLRILALPETACTLADAAREHVAKNRMLAYQVAPRIAWYRSLWERREALFAAQQVRIRANYDKAA